MTEVTSPQLDLNARAIWNSTFWGGIGFRPQDAVVLSAGLMYDWYTFGYNYDITVGQNMLSAHSHELSFGYFLSTKRGFRARRGRGGPLRANDRILK